MIKKLSLARLFALALLTGVAPAAHAISLSITPSSQSVGVGGSVVVDLGISGLGDGVPPSMGGFDVDIAFDASVLLLTGANLIAALGNSAVLNFVVESSASGTHVNLNALSTFTPEELDEQQADAFTIARLTFLAYGPGTSPLTLGNVSLTNATGGALPLDSIGDGEIDVVPEPATSIGVGLGLVALAFRRFRLPR